MKVMKMNVNLVYDKIIEILKNSDRDISYIEKKELLGHTAIYVNETLAIKIKTTKTKFYIMFRKDFLTHFENNENISIAKSDLDWFRYSLNNINDLIIMSDVIIDIYDNTESQVDFFSCCSRYMECSDAKVCIHPDKIHAQGCNYKLNLEVGKIFYGVNANQHLQNMQPQKNAEHKDDNKNDIEQISFI